jgi:serine/threonine protein kinase
MIIKLRCKHCFSKISAEDDLIGKEVFCPACNAVIPLPTPQFGCGSKINGFEIEQWLGSGAMGEVYLATQVSMRRKVALKTLPFSDMVNDEDKKRFLKEAQILAKLNHPNIVPAYDAGSTANCHYMSMGYINGKTLEDMQRKSGVLAELEMLDVMKKLSNALNYAWTESKLLHRDIKPANIMVDEFNIVKLMDMGIAKNMNEDASLTQAGFIVGTPYFMSPEQAQSSPNLDFRSDLYALGCTIYQMLSGKLPYTGPNIMAILSNKMSNNFIPLERVTGHVSAPTCKLINSLINFNPDLRPQSFEEFDTAIDECTKTAMNHSPTVEITNFDFDLEAPTQIQKATPINKNRDFALVSVLLVLLIIALTSFLLLDEDHEETRSNSTLPVKVLDNTLPSFSIADNKKHEEILALLKGNIQARAKHMELRGEGKVQEDKIILNGGKLVLRGVGRALNQAQATSNQKFIYIEFKSDPRVQSGIIFTIQNMKTNEQVTLKQKEHTLIYQNLKHTINLGVLKSATNAIAIHYKQGTLQIAINGKTVHNSKNSLFELSEKTPLFLGGEKQFGNNWTGTIYRAYTPSNIPEEAIQYFFN